jgi:hypothetical protein
LVICRCRERTTERTFRFQNPVKIWVLLISDRFHVEPRDWRVANGVQPTKERIGIDGLVCPRRLRDATRPECAMIGKVQGPKSTSSTPFHCRPLANRYARNPPPPPPVARTSDLYTEGQNARAQIPQLKKVIL